MEIYLILSALWYLIGSFGGIWVSKRMEHSKITNADVLFCFTLGGIGGLFTFLIGLLYLPKSKWFDKENKYFN